MDAAMTEFRLPPLADVSVRESGSGRDPLAEMAEQVRLVNDAAASAADRVAEAAERLRQPGGDFRSELLADLGSSLVERVNEIQAECERLSRTLERATKIARREDAGSPRPLPAPPAVPELIKPAGVSNGRPTAAPVEPEPVETVRVEAEPVAQPLPARTDRRRAPGQSTPEGVRLAATQMAVAGSSRWEIERCLRIQFGVHDADAALDEIFGTRQSEV